MNIQWKKKRKGFSLIYTTQDTPNAIVHTRFGSNPGIFYKGKSYDSVDAAKRDAESEITMELGNNLRLDAQGRIDGLVVAHMLLDFYSDFSDVYGTHVLFPGVGPMQSFLGWAIGKGYLSVPAGSDVSRSLVSETSDEY